MASRPHLVIPLCCSVAHPTSLTQQVFEDSLALALRKLRTGSFQSFLQCDLSAVKFTAILLVRHAACGTPLTFVSLVLALVMSVVHSSHAGQFCAL
jgi:hypothetical protein